MIVQETHVHGGEMGGSPEESVGHGEVTGGGCFFLIFLRLSGEWEAPGCG